MKATIFALLLAAATVHAEPPLEKPLPPAPPVPHRMPFLPGDKVRVQIAIPWEYSAVAYGIVLRTNEGNTADILFIKVGGDTGYAPGVPFSVLEKR